VKTKALARRHGPPSIGERLHGRGFLSDGNPHIEPGSPVRVNVVRSQCVDDGIASRRVGFGGPREKAAARRIGPERQRQALQQVTDPADTNRLPPLQPRNRDGVSGHHGNAQVGPEPLRRRPDDSPVFCPFGERHKG